MTHPECVEKLKQTGIHLGFEAPGRSYGKMYPMGNPDCVWYYKGTGQEAFRKIAKGDRNKYLPLAAFEVAHSEDERGSKHNYTPGQIRRIQVLPHETGRTISICAVPHLD